MQCPRCDEDTVEVMVKSPVGDVWEMYLCNTCFYSWRSTETVDINPIFKVKKENITKLGIIPPVPPLNPGVKA